MSVLSSDFEFANYRARLRGGGGDGDTLTSQSSQGSQDSQRYSVASSQNDVRSVDSAVEFPAYTVGGASEGGTSEYDRVRQELYDSERAYLRYLSILQRLYINPLARLPNLISKHDLRSLFGELTSIYNVNKEVLAAMRQNERIHTAFSTMGPFLRLYTTYARNYTTSQKTYNRLMLKSEFREFVEEQEADQRSLGIKFMSLMIMPIQRIPRYVLLMKRLRDESPCEKEKEDIEAALSEMSETTDLIEMCIRDFENGEKLWDIQESLGLKEDIVAPGRRFIREGPLFKATYSERQFWLLSDCLVYGKRRFGMGPRFECSCIFPLRHCEIAYNEIDGSIQLKCKNHSLLLTSDSYEVLKSWSEDIATAIERAKLLRSTLRKESSRQGVKEYKSRIKKKFTKQFVKKTYLYDMSNLPSFRRRQSQKHQQKKQQWEAAADVPSDINVMSSPFAPSTSRKRNPPFDAELQCAVESQRRKVDNHSASSSEHSEQSVSSRTRSQAGSSRYHTPMAESRRRPAPPPPVREEEQEKEEEGEGVDECDKAHTRGVGTVRMRPPRTIIVPEQPPYRPHEAFLTPRTELTRPEIRKYSYQEPCDDSSANESSASSHEPAISASHTRNTTPHRRSRHTIGEVPWWVTESTPAQYTNAKKQRRLPDVVDKCTIL